MCDYVEVETKNNLEYVFIPVASNAIRFRVRAANDAHIALTKGTVEKDPMTEIRFGGWGNTKSIIRRDRTKPNKAQVTMPGILNRDVYRGLWVRWYGNYIAAGFEGIDRPFMAYKEPSPHPIDHIAVRTGWGATGSWKIEVSPVIFKSLTPKPLGEELHWVPLTRYDDMPLGAVIGGYEKGEVLYIARAMHNHSMRPGKYVPSLKRAYINCHNTVFTKDVFEILCGYNLSWVKMKGNALPPHAFPGGTTSQRSNENLYIGRVYIENNLIPGEVNIQSKACCIPYGNPEIQKMARNFEVLVVPDKLPENLIWHTPKRTRISVVMTARQNDAMRHAVWRVAAFRR